MCSDKEHVYISWMKEITAYNSVHHPDIQSSMFSKLRRRAKNRLTPTGNRPSPRNSQETRIQDSTLSFIEQQERKPIEIDCLQDVHSVAFLADGEHIVSGGRDGKIHRLRTKDGKEVGTPMDAERVVGNIAISRNGKWIVSSGFWGGKVIIWDAESYKKVKEIQGYKDAADVVDISPDAEAFATGSLDGTTSVWSISTGRRLLGPLKHARKVAAVKFSPDGHLIATVTSHESSVRVYDSRNGRLLVEYPIYAVPCGNQSLEWGSDKQLFVFSIKGRIHSLDVYTKKELSKWRIHSNNEPRCISLASNGAFIAASANSSVSFWDTTTHDRIGSVIHHPTYVSSMAISENCDLVTAGGTKIMLRNLLDILPSSYFDNFRPTRAEANHLQETVKSPNAEYEPHNEEIVHHEKALIASQSKAKQKEDSLSLNGVIRLLRAENTDLNAEVANLKEKLADSHKVDDVIKHLHAELGDSQRKIGRLTKILCAHGQKHECETLYAGSRVVDAAELLLEMVGTLSDDVKADTLIMDWLSGFTNKCISELERIGDEALNMEKHGGALTAFSIALSLGPSAPDTLLIKWANTILLRNLIDEALDVATQFKVPRFLIYRSVCDTLEGDNRITEAIGCFQRMQSELIASTTIHEDRAQWELSFPRRCMQRLEDLADLAVSSRKYNEAVGYFSAILSLDPVDYADALIKRSEAQAMMGLWEDALKDANEVIGLDLSFHRGYEQKIAVLHAARRFVEAVEAFDTMLSKLEQSPDQRVRELRYQYIDARPAIRQIIHVTVSNMPRVLIDTATGRLQDRKQVANAFEGLPIFAELVSSMVTELDRPRIQREVKEIYEYVMFSHKWEDGEPLLENVQHVSVYELEPSPGNTKLQMFCSHVRFLGFQWAWSDTCCIDKDNHVVLQESLVAMFAWYRGSSLTLVYLCDVSSQSEKPGDVKESIWNTRAWTYQEYLAAERVQFYTRDWKPYLGLTFSNHKESPDIISEMEQVSQVSSERLALLQPGLDRVREKLFLASMRQTTFVEDIAYSLLGIFNVAIPVIYGEGNRAVGRLLEHLLTGSGDVTILAWTGTANKYNSCLPTDLTVYKELVPAHIPPAMEMVEVDRIVAELRISVTDLSSAMVLYDRLNELPSASLASSRLRLPGIVSLVTNVAYMSGPDPKTSLCVYRGTTAIFGDIEIKTIDNLTTMNSLHLVHPWIRPLLDQEFSRAPPNLDKTTRALRLIAHLMQPFGALLFEKMSRVEYKRVAADSLIMVQVCKDVSLEDLIDNILVIEVQ